MAREQAVMKIGALAPLIISPRALIQQLDCVEITSKLMIEEMELDALVQRCH